MRPLYSVYAAVSATALLGLTFAALPKVARSGQPLLLCGTYTPTRAEAQKAEFYINKAITGNGNLKPGTELLMRAPGSAVISVYFHVITPKNGSIGNLTNAQIQEQIAVMNKIYSGQDPLPAGVKPLGPSINTPFRFQLAEIDRTASDDYFYKGNYAYPDIEKKMKGAMRIGSGRTLNIYTNELSGIGLAGYATFPMDYGRYATLDGVVLSYEYLPNIPGPRGLGKVLVHEVGHWLGLYHTFQGGCSKPNDYVDDTPMEFTSFFGSWLPGSYPGYVPDSCTGRFFTGKDPVDNYMDYSDSVAWSRFTAGQISRMDMLCRIYRGL